MIATETKPKNWYTIKVQNAREKSVSERLKADMIREFNEEVKFLIPTQQIASIKNGKKVFKEQTLYPGYIFVETSTIDKVAHLIKTTNGATNVLSDKTGKPIVMKQTEIERMLGEKEKSVIKGDIFMIDEMVTINNGPFDKFKGKITTLDFDRNKVKVEVMIFGRATSVDLTLDDISKENV